MGTQVDLDHSVGHFRICAADFKVRAADRLSPKSLQTLSAVSDQTITLLLLFLQVERCPRYPQGALRIIAALTY